MTKEQKDAIIAEGVAEEAKEQANATFEDSIKDLSDDEKSTKRTEREATEGDKAKVDYKKITAAERLRRKNAEEALAKKRIDEKKDKKDGEGDGSGEGEDDLKPLTRAEGKAMLDKSTHEAKAREIAKRLAGDDTALMEATLDFWSKTPLKGIETIEKQIEFVIGGLNSGKLIAKNQELKRALASRGSVYQGGTNGTKVEVGADEPEMPSHDRQALAQSGFIWDAALKLYKRVLKGSKKTLYHDPVKNKRFSK